MWSIIVASDLHFGKSADFLCAKIEILNKIIQKKDEDNIQVVISAGDLTEYGTDGFQMCGLMKKNNNNELISLKNQWVKPLEDNNITILLTIGNHDTYVPWPYLHKPVMEYVSKKHNATFYPIINMYRSGYYSFEKNGVLFLSFGIKPTYWKWIKENLTHDKPMIIFFHYNIINDEPYSNWWSDKEKNTFLKLIEPYKQNILCLINGHLHASSIKEWNGIQVINGAGINESIKIVMDETKIHYSEIF